MNSSVGRRFVATGQRNRLYAIAQSTKQMSSVLELIARFPEDPMKALVCNPHFLLGSSLHFSCENGIESKKHEFALSCPSRQA
ncbi:Glutamine synthetase [Frankliniella fusca]|uniref:Glutamine synthetase n=1 Tax=Frankliniella fusca TaxID=407009 RepID=A0AAE1GTD6_9NEOP|nr:Glutamine synthetase [Frankliniella fusca]